MSKQIIFVLLAGALGGILRGVLGIAKSLVLKKEFEVNWLWFWVTVGVSAILGMIASSFLIDDIRMALVGGYAGTDFLEGLAKILLKEKFGPKKQEKKKSGFGKLLKKS